MSSQVVDLRRQKPLDPAELALRGKVYTYLMGELSLSDFHRQQLTARGLTEEQIFTDGYRTFDRESLVHATSVLEKNFTQEQLALVPGFTQKSGDFTGGTFVWPVIEAGLGVPIYGLHGDIRAIQVRQDTGPIRYKTLSGGDGGSIGSPVHIPIRAVNDLLSRHPLIITEGPIKANVVTYNFGPCIGLLGVNGYKPLLGILRKYKPSTIFLGFDMDRLTKPGVAEAQKRLAKELTKLGVKEIEVLSWNPEYKGLDDAVMAAQPIEGTTWGE